jgi:RNA polymerase sigma-70 factor (ECF subfamily)
VASISDAKVKQREAFAREAMIHLDHLYRVAFHLAKNQDEVQDLVQETFVRALASYEQFNPPTNMRAWLTKILQNLFFDRYRQNKRWLPLENNSAEETASVWENEPETTTGPEGQFLQRELRARINDCLRKIPEEFRVAIVLVDMSEFSYTEAAEILSCPVGTIRSRLSRGRRLLQKRLARYVDVNDETDKHEMRGRPRTYNRPG